MEIEFCVCSGRLIGGYNLNVRKFGKFLRLVLFDDLLIF